MEMGAYGADGHFEGGGDLFVTLFFLMIEHEDGAFDGAELLEAVFDGLSELAFGELLFGVGRWVGEAILPVEGVVFIGGGDGDERTVVATPAFPFVLGDIDDDAVEEGGEQGFPAECGQGAVEAEEDILGEVFEVFAATREAQEGAKHHGLMVADELLEMEVVILHGMDCGP